MKLCLVRLYNTCCILLIYFAGDAKQKKLNRAPAKVSILYFFSLKQTTVKLLRLTWYSACVHLLAHGTALSLLISGLWRNQYNYTICNNTIPLESGDWGCIRYISVPTVLCDFAGTARGQLARQVHNWVASHLAENGNTADGPLGFGEFQCTHRNRIWYASYLWNSLQKHIMHRVTA